MQAELARLRDAYVADSLEFREAKSALQARVRALEAELVLAKNLCKQQDYELQHAPGSSTAATAAALVADNVVLDQENAALRKRVREYEAQEKGHAEMKKRVKELEVVERAWAHLSGVFASAR